MCLRRLYQKPKKFRGRTAYKILYCPLFPGGADYRSPYQDKSYQVGKWNHAIEYDTPKMLKTVRYASFYQSGSHCFTNKKDALRFLRYKKSLDLAKWVAVKVELRDITAYGEDWYGPVVVARHMRIIGEVS